MAPKHQHVKSAREIQADQIRRTVPFYPPREGRASTEDLSVFVANRTGEHSATILTNALVGPHDALNAAVDVPPRRF
jgi:hypothetical protein